MNPNEPPSFFSRPPLPTSDNPLSIQGRFGRLSYIAWMTFLHIIGFAIMMIWMLTMGVVGLGVQSLNANIVDTLTGLNGFGFFVIYVLYIYFYIVLTARRLHDLNSSAWLIVLCFIPVINLFMWLYLILMPGTRGQNGYGAERITAIWEKILAWVIIFVTTLILISLSAIVSYMIGAGEIDTPTEILQQTTEYF